MNYYDAQAIIRRHKNGLQVAHDAVEEAIAFIANGPRRVASNQLRGEPQAIVSPPQLKPPMGAKCECGCTYGQHRVNDFACRNAHWRPGNGEPQWLETSFRRAA